MFNLIDKEIIKRDKKEHHDVKSFLRNSFDVKITFLLGYLF